MNWNYSLILGHEDEIKTAYKCKERHPRKIKRMKFTTSSLEKGLLKFGQAKEMQQELKWTGIDVYVWWWVTDDAIENWKLSKHISQLQELWISTIEVWNPTPEIITTLRWEFSTVISEIWSKGWDEYSHDHTAWEKSLKTSLDGWIQDIVLEGWNGRVWIYTRDYKVRTLLIIHLLKIIEESWHDIDTVLESPQPPQQHYLYSLLWRNIHLWNIHPFSLSKKDDVPQVDKIGSDFSPHHPNIIWKFYEIVDYLFESAGKRWIDPSDFFFDDRLTNVPTSEIFEIESYIKGALNEIVPINDGLHLNLGTSIHELLTHLFGRIEIR